MAPLLLHGLARGSATTGMQLESSASIVTWGDAVRFTGSVSAPDAPECAHGVEVLLEKDAIDDEATWLEVGRARTDAEGRFSVDVMVEESASYAAYNVPEQGSACEAAGSESVEVMARFQVTLERSALIVPRGGRVRLTVRSRPHCPGYATGDSVSIPLYQLRDGRFVRVAVKRDLDACKATFVRRIRRTAVFMSKVGGTEGTNAVYLSGRSAEKAVDVRD